MTEAGQDLWKEVKCLSSCVRHFLYSISSGQVSNACDPVWVYECVHSKSQWCGIRQTSTTESLFIILDHELTREK